MSRWRKGRSERRRRSRRRRVSGLDGNAAVERARVFFKFKTLLEENFDDLVRSNTREHGKTLVESRGDVKRGIEMVEFACGVPSLLMGEALENLARGIDCETIRQPLGVCAGITPFNFPCHGAALDVSHRHRLRQHVRAQAERKSSAHRHQNRQAV